MTRFRSVLLAASVVFSAGCASLQTAASAPINGTSAIAGTWTGTVTPGHWGVADPLPRGQLSGGSRVAEGSDA